ncbi:MAG: hypothetical protein WC788_04605 [Candidatus Paceibacterota bacterium]|jgi:hypothetical protein
MKFGSIEQNMPQEAISPVSEAERILRIEDPDAQEDEIKKIQQLDENFAHEVREEIDKILMEPGE